MSRVRVLPRHPKGVLMVKITPLFAITSLYEECYHGVKSSYIAGDLELFNCDILGLIGLLSSKEIRQQALGLPSPTSPVTENKVSDAPAPFPPTGRPQPSTSPSATTSFKID